MLKNSNKIIIACLIGLACVQWPLSAHATDSAKQPVVDEEKPVKSPENIAATQQEQRASYGFTGNYLSGLFARSNGDIQSAILYLRKAHQKDPGNQDVIVELQGVLLLDGKVEEAIALASESRVPTEDPISNLLLSLKAIKKEDIDQARTLLNNSADAGTGQLWLPLILAWLDVSQHKLVKPITIEELSANVGRASSIVNYHLALINAEAGFKEAAALNFKNAIEDAQDPPGRIMEMLLSFYERNEKPQALAPLVTTYNKANPNDDVNNNIPTITTAQDGVAEVLFTMGSVMSNAGINQDATIYLRLALYMKPQFAAAALALGDAYSDLRQFAKANEAYATIPATNRIYLTAQLHMALNSDRMGKLPQATALLDNLSKKMPDRYEALVAKADLLRMHSRFADAVQAYNQALKRIPELKTYHWAILFARGTCYERLNKWPQAEKDLQQALELKPEQPEVLNYLGYSWLVRQEHIAEARDMLEKAIKKRPDDAQIVDSMGWALYMLGQYDDAASYTEKALTLLPSDPTVNDHLGDIYWRQGRKTEARYQWSRSLSFSPETVAAEATRKKLKEGLPPQAANIEKPPVVASQQQHEEGATVP